VIKTGRRRIIRHGGSYGITIPRKFLELSGLKVGDRVGIVYNRVLLVINPNPELEESKDIKKKDRDNCSE